MTARDLLSWYEANLPARERKLRGHFSTPQRLVEHILDACNYTPTNDLTKLRVLDPACGSGNFLAGAAQRLLAFGKQRGDTPRKQAQLLQRNLWGFDPDPNACFLAEMHLQQTFSQIALPEETTQTNRRKRGQILRQLHIHQADGLAFPWDSQPNVDLFLANPPYLASKNADLSSYLSTSQHGQVDSYLLFLRLALQVVRPGGWIGLVLPDPLLARANATHERQRLLAETTIHQLWHLSEVFTANVGAVVIIAQKQPPTFNHELNWVRGQWMREGVRLTNIKSPVILQARQDGASIAATHKGTIAQHLLRQQPRAELRYLLSDIDDALLLRLHTHGASSREEKTTGLLPLKQFVLIGRGEEIAKERVSTAEAVDEQVGRWYPVLRGGVDMRPYGQPRAHYWLPASAIRKTLARYQAAKLLITKSVGRLQAALDLAGHVVLQTLYTLHLEAQRPDLWQGQESEEHEDELYFLLALLNSRLLQKYIHTSHTAYKWIQPQIEQHVLANLPIPVVASRAEKEQIVQLARQLVHTCDKMAMGVELADQGMVAGTGSNLYTQLYEEQEQVIRLLYTRALHREICDERCRDGEGILPQVTLREV